jgi:enterochelin esterase-like enzyme
MRTRTSFIGAALAVLAAGAQAPLAQQQSATPAGGAGRAGPAQGGPVRSPEVLADRRVTFRLSAPKASDVRLTCECFNDAQVLKKDDRGVWSVTVGPIAPDIYEYEFSVDGAPMIDPRNPAIKYNSRPNPASSLLEVPAGTPMFYDVRPIPHGVVSVRWYNSKATGTVRRVHIYTPPNYDKTSAKMPVLYLLHGADGDDSAWTWFGRANNIVDNLLSDGKAQPMVIVMPFGYAYSWNAGAAADKQRTDFEKDLLEDLIPFVQANYRVHTDRQHRALVGLSMGGGQALGIGLHHLDLFSRVAGFSAAVARQPYTAFKDVSADPKKVNASLKLLWMGCGREDGLFTPNKEFAEFLKSNGINNTFVESPGAHTWINWRRYLLEVAPKLWVDK